MSHAFKVLPFRWKALLILALLFIPIASGVFTNWSTWTTAGAPPSLDIDLDGTVNPMTDAQIVTRFLLDLTGPDLVTGIINPAGLRTDPDEIVAYLEPLRFTMLDVDTNGVADAETDAKIIVAYTFGLRGEALISGFIGANAQRTTAPEIEAFLAGFMPGVNTPLEAHAGPDHTVFMGGIAHLDGQMNHLSSVPAVVELAPIAAGVEAPDRSPLRHTRSC